MINMIKSRLLPIFIKILGIALFVLVLYYVYATEAWQANMGWAIFMVISSILVPFEELISFYKNGTLKHLALNTLLAFCLIGNHLFVYPLDKKADVLSVVVFIVFTVAVSPIVTFISTLPQRKRILKILKGSGNKKNIHIVFYALIPLVMGSLMMYAFNPCIVSYDAHYVIAQAKGLEPIQDYIGVPYILWYRFLLNIVDSTMFLCIMQIIIYTVVLSCFLYYIETSYNIKFSVLILLFIGFSVMPNNLMMLVTLSKDVYYGINLCLMLFALLLLIRRESFKNFLFCAVSFVLTWSIRPSGIIVVLFTVIIGLLLINNKKYLLISASSAILLSMIINMGVTNITCAEKTPGGLKYLALYQDILGVFYSQGELSDAALSVVEIGVGDDPEFSAVYTPYWANYDGYYEKIADVGVYDFISCYLDTFFRNPIMMTRSILCRTDMMWDIHPGINAKQTWQWYIGNTGGKYTYLIEERKSNGLANIFNFIGEKSKEHPFKDLIWRVALYNVFLMCILHSIKNKKGYLVVLPLGGYLFSYVVSLGWSHYRYYWADGLLVFMAVICFFADCVPKVEGDNEANDVCANGMIK